jgi:hypothetical protein
MDASPLSRLWHGASARWRSRIRCRTIAARTVSELIQRNIDSLFGVILNLSCCADKKRAARRRPREEPKLRVLRNAEPMTGFELAHVKQFTLGGNVLSDN